VHRRAPSQAAPCTSGRFLALKTGAQTFHSFSFIYPRHVMHVQSCSSSRYRNHSRNVLTIDSLRCLRSTSLTPVDVPFNVVRYS
jgi:hypothetical protein